MAAIAASRQAARRPHAVGGGCWQGGDCYCAGVNLTAASLSRSIASANSARVRHPVVAELQSHLALGALDAIGLRAAQVEIGVSSAILDEFAAHRGRLRRRRRPGPGAPPRKLPSRRRRPAHRDHRRSRGRSPGFELPARFRPVKFSTINCLRSEPASGVRNRKPRTGLTALSKRRRWVPDVYRIRLFCHAFHRRQLRPAPGGASTSPSVDRRRKSGPEVTLSARSARRVGKPNPQTMRRGACGLRGALRSRVAQGVIVVWSSITAVASINGPVSASRASASS